MYKVNAKIKYWQLNGPCNYEYYEHTDRFCIVLEATSRIKAKEKFNKYWKKYFLKYAKWILVDQDDHLRMPNCPTDIRVSKCKVDYFLEQVKR
jgi:hypothetical protein